MAAYDLEEQEQLSAIKAWWERYGNLVTALVTAVAVGVVGYQLWGWYQRGQSAQAAVLFAAVQKAAAERDAKTARERTGELLEKYSGTAYAGMAALISGKVQFEAGDLKSARAQLAWAAENSRDAQLRDLARLRAAYVLLDEKAYDEALKQLEKEPLAAYAARFAELRGDLYAAQSKRVEARQAYQSALAKLDETQKSGGGTGRAAAPYRELLQTKLEALGDGQ
jgi:predicted negative regulator of RcsB-dependent stress response